ncbi:MAG: methyltransferase domain-containing protein [Acidiferrobacterales bacterium]
MSVTSPTCRSCHTPLQHTFADLGVSPLANAFLRPDQLHEMEPFYALHAYVCEQCFLVQLEELESAGNIFTDYAYFSSYSDTWLRHAKNYTDYVIKRFALDPTSHVVEIASNDGHLLRYFQQRDIPVLGIEPAQNVAKVAIDAGVPTLAQFFGETTANQLAAEDKYADLLLGNNVLAHVPDLNGFVRATKVLLKPRGVITMEFPHLLRLMEGNQFDTIYHEHFSYFSLLAAQHVFASHRLTVFDVEQLTTHGGSLRLFVRHAEDDTKPVSERVSALLTQEKLAGLDSLQTYAHFSEHVGETKRALLEFLINAKREGKSIAAYGAPAKGNTLLNYCGIRTDFIDYTVDRNPYKQGRYLPGTHIPIFHPDKVKDTKPDYLLILPWNLMDEIVQQMAYIRAWAGTFVVPIPTVELVP